MSRRKESSHVLKAGVDDKGLTRPMTFSTTKTAAMCCGGTWNILRHTDTVQPYSVESEADEES